MNNPNKYLFSTIFLLTSFFLFPNFVFASEPVDNLDLAIFHFNEPTSDIAKDSSLNGYDLKWGCNPWGEGKIVPTRVPGKWDLGIDFNQTEEAYYLKDSRSISLDNGLTIGLWIKTNNSSNDKTRFLWLGNWQESVIHNPSNFILLSIQNGQVYLDLKQKLDPNKPSDWQQSIISKNQINDNTWHFITATLNPTNHLMTLFVDGQSQGETSFSLPIPIMDYISLGRREYYFDPYEYNFQGSIDDLWLRSEPLSLEQILSIYQSNEPYKQDNITPPRVEPTVFANYSFDNLNLTSAPDLSGNNHTFTWGNNPYSPGSSPLPRSVPGKFGQGINFQKLWEAYYQYFYAPKTEPFPNGASFNMWIKTNEVSNPGARFFWYGNRGDAINNGWPLQDYLVMSEEAGNIKVKLNYYDGEYPDARKKYERNYTLNSDQFISDNNWHFISVTLDPRPNIHTMKLYIDGELKNTSFFPDTLPEAREAYLGYHELGNYGDISYNFNGDMDDVSILKSTLTDENIKDLYQTNQSFTWPIQKRRNPVIIVPGIISSYLNRNEPGLPEMWPNLLKMSAPGEDSYLYDLSLDQYGWSNDVNIKPTDIFRSVGDKDVFEGLITELEKVGYTENENLFVFPYDWRLNVSWIAGDSPISWQKTLKQKIEEVIASTGAEKVDIIAHSMGGLVTKSYMKNYGKNKIDKFIDIGTPHYGTPNALKMLIYGDDMGFTYKGLEVNPITMKNISQNMPSVFDLLPSQAYQDLKVFSAPDMNYSSYIADVYDFDKNNIKGNLDYYSSQAFMKNVGLNTTLLTEANNLHADIDNFNFDKTYNIVGCGTPTIGKIYIINKEKSGGYEYGLKYIDGDGTVPLRSANALDTSQTYYAKGAEHGVLPSFDGIKQFIASILSSNQNKFSISDYQNFNNSSVNCGINGTEISFHSPIDIHIYDEFGNHAGPDENGEIENNITGASYNIIDGNKFIFLQAGRNFKVTGQASAVGSFNARIQTIENSEYTEEAYFNDIPLTANTKIKMDDLEQKIIEYDGNGDGLIDKIIDPSSVLGAEAMQDIEKPITKINVVGTVGNNDWYISTTTISLISEDNAGGSGILKTEYKIDGNSWQDYIGPVNISEGVHNVLYKSTDKAGNVEEDKRLSFKVDVSAPLISDILPSADMSLLHSEVTPLLYSVNDNISGLATDTVKIMIDSVEIKNNQLDLFNYKIGKHKIEIMAEDLAGNKATTVEVIEIVTNFDSLIKDVSRLYLNHDITKEKVSYDIINDIKKIEDETEKYQEKIKNKKIFFKTIYDKCLIKYKKEKCEKIIEATDKFFTRVEIKHDNKINKIIEEIFKDLEQFRKKNWINEFGYVIIKDNINYIKENL